MMPTHLIVAYQTAGGRPLKEAIEEFMNWDSEARFKLLVPATRTQHLFTWTEGESHAVAEATAESAANRLKESGVPLTGVTVGDPDPVVAVTNELASNDFESIIVSTFPPGISRWLRLDLPTRLEKMTGLPVTHVIVEPDETTSS